MLKLTTANSRRLTLSVYLSKLAHGPVEAKSSSLPKWPLCFFLSQGILCRQSSPSEPLRPSWPLSEWLHSWISTNPSLEDSSSSLKRNLFTLLNISFFAVISMHVHLGIGKNVMIQLTRRVIWIARHFVTASCFRPCFYTHKWKYLELQVSSNICNKLLLSHAELW